MPPRPPSRVHALVAIVLIVLGAYPFLSGAFRTRSMLWNSASFVLLLSGIYSFLVIWKAFSMSRPRR